MKPITLAQVRQVVSGKALTVIPPAAEVASISTDTRNMEPGAMFVAIRGQNMDGHEFLPQAAAKGAVAAMVEREPSVRLPNMHFIQVADARQAMGRLATFVRCQMSAKVIGVGGSNGKTGTKNLIDSALCRRLKGSISPKSFNNDIGVPITIFAADPSQDYLVLEMGTNHPGEIEVLTMMARPDIAVITCCAPEHLEGLKDLMGVRQEEASIIHGLDPRGLLVVNGDDPHLVEAVSSYPGNKVTFGLNPANDLYATDIRQTFRGVCFRLNGRREVFVPLLGRHNACNSLAAIAVARRLGLGEDEIVDALAVAHGPEMRLQLQNLHGINLLNDAYNANPSSMQAAIETLFELDAPGRRIAILGDMFELGESSERYHREMGRFVAGLPLDLLICVGAQARLIAEESLAGGFSPSRIIHCPDAPAAARIVPSELRGGDLVLLKGSRGMRLERIAQAIGAGEMIRAAS